MILNKQQFLKDLFNKMQQNNNDEFLITKSEWHGGLVGFLGSIPTWVCPLYVKFACPHYDFVGLLLVLPESKICI